MSRFASTGRRISDGILLGSILMASPLASATTTGTASGLKSADALTTFLDQVGKLFTGGLGIAIGVIAFACVGVYIMYARQTGQAVGSIAKVFVGLLILFGGTTMIKEIGTATGGAIF